MIGCSGLSWCHLRNLVRRALPFLFFTSSGQINVKKKNSKKLLCWLQIVVSTSLAQLSLAANSAVIHLPAYATSQAHKFPKGPDAQITSLHNMTWWLFSSTKSKNFKIFHNVLKQPEVIELNLHLNSSSMVSDKF